VETEEWPNPLPGWDRRAGKLVQWMDDHQATYERASHSIQSGSGSNRSPTQLMKTHAGVSEKLTVCPKRLYFLSDSDDDMISQPTRIHFFDSQLWTWQHRHYAQLRLRQRMPALFWVANCWCRGRKGAYPNSQATVKIRHQLRSPTKSTNRALGQTRSLLECSFRPFTQKLGSFFKLDLFEQ
jgi:hypothetical protein